MPRSLSDDDATTVVAIRAGDEAAFAALLDRLTPAMVRVAASYVPSHAVAEDVVQEAWIAVLRGIDRFEGRSSLKTWIFRIVVNAALRAGSRERRSVPFATLVGTDDSPSIDPARFLPRDDKPFGGHWVLMPTPWQTPEEGLLAGETREVILTAIADLPKAQQTVITLRDVEGWPADEVCDALGISAGNQRILLHRARANVRLALEDYFGAAELIDYAAVTGDRSADSPEQERLD